MPFVVCCALVYFWTLRFSRIGDFYTLRLGFFGNLDLRIIDKKEPGLELSSPGIYIDKLLYDLGCNKRLYSKSSFIISIALTNEGFRGFITLK